jgi:hypothetical protein
LWRTQYAHKSVLMWDIFHLCSNFILEVTYLLSFQPCIIWTHAQMHKTFDFRSEMWSRHFCNTEYACRNYYGWSCSVNEKIYIYVYISALAVSMESKILLLDSPNAATNVAWDGVRCEVNGLSHRLGTRAVVRRINPTPRSEGGGLPPGGSATDRSATPLHCFAQMWWNTKPSMFHGAGCSFRLIALNTAI